MKKSCVLLVFVFFSFILSCSNESSLILGKWSLNNDNSKYGKMELSFFPKNVFTKVYFAKNKMNTQIKNSGKWNFDEENRILELLNDNGNTIEMYQIELLSRDSLIWSAFSKKINNSVQLELFTREE